MGNTYVIDLSQYLMPSKRTLRVNAMALQLSDFWQHRTRCLRQIGLISYLLMHHPHPLPLILSCLLWVLGFLHQVCPHQAHSHLQCHLLEPFLQEYPQQCLPHLCLLELEPMAHHQQEPLGLDILDMDTHIPIHSHQVGCLIPVCLRCSSPTMAPMAWDTPMQGPQAQGDNLLLDHHQECLILALLLWECRPEDHLLDLPWVTQAPCPPMGCEDLLR